ncbi:MAG: hypothetical protein ABR507_10005 [Actinomycetota bacterium]
MQKTELIVENVCPDCGRSACVQFLSVDGKEIHINCLDCNRVYAAAVPAKTTDAGGAKGNTLEVTRWRELGSFVRL